MPIVWTKELVSHLRRLYDDQFSYAEIAEKLQAMGYPATKNCCVGKGRRLGLALRREPHPPSEKIQRRQQQRLRDAQRKREQRRLTHMNGHGTGEPKVYRLTPERAGRKALRTGLLIDLDPDQCHWPLEEISHHTYQFCCEDSEYGRPYCTIHADIAYGANRRV